VCNHCGTHGSPGVRQEVPPRREARRILRVIETGYVKANDPVEFIPYGGELVGILEMFRSFYRKRMRLTENELRRFLAVPIAIRDRLHYEMLLATVLADTAL